MKKVIFEHEGDGWAIKAQGMENAADAAAAVATVVQIIQGLPRLNMIHAFKSGKSYKINITPLETEYVRQQQENFN